MLRFGFVCECRGFCHTTESLPFSLFIKGMSIFFLGSLGMNRSAGQTNRVNREAVLGRFVCSALRCILHEPRKKTLIPYIYNVSIKIPFLNSPRKVTNSTLFDVNHRAWDLANYCMTLFIGNGIENFRMVQ